MQLLYQIKATDGLANSTDPITWQAYSGSQDNFMAIPDNTLMDINAPNINATNARYYPFKTSGYPTYKFLTLDPSNNTWIDSKDGQFPQNWPEATTTLGYKLVVIPVSGRLDIYMAKDNSEYSLIPNISQQMRIETYISDNINSTTFGTYRQWGVYGSVSDDPFIPLMMFSYMQSTPTTKAMSGIGIKKITREGVTKYCWGSFSAKPGTATFNGTEDGLLPTIITNYYSASESPSPVANLDSRVTILESEVSELQSKVSDLEKQIKNIPELIAWTNEAVSKHYVAR